MANAEQKWDFDRTEIGSCRTEPVEQKSDHRSETGNTSLKGIPIIPPPKGIPAFIKGIPEYLPQKGIPT